MLAEERIWKIKREKAEKGKARKVTLITVVAISIFTVWQEADVTCRLYYTDAVRYQEDLQLAGHLEYDIARFTGDCNYDGTVVFVGKRNATGNCASIRGDVMGQSLFAWDTDVEPKNYWSSGRIVGFMHCQGANYKAPNVEQVEKAVKYAKNMKCYPADGSIGMYSDVVVVKLSGE